MLNMEAINNQLTVQSALSDADEPKREQQISRCPALSSWTGMMVHCLLMDRETLLREDGWIYIWTYSKGKIHIRLL